MSAPCGVPLTADRVAPCSTTPAFSHLRISRSTALVADTVLDKPHHPLVADVVEEPFDVGVQYPVHRPMLNADHQRVQGVVLAPSGSKPVGEADEVRLVDRIEHLDHRALDDLVLEPRDAERALSPVRFWDVGT